MHRVKVRKSPASVRTEGWESWGVVGSWIWRRKKLYPTNWILHPVNFNVQHGTKFSSASDGDLRQTGLPLTIFLVNIPGGGSNDPPEPSRIRCSGAAGFLIEGWKDKDNSRPVGASWGQRDHNWIDEVGSLAEPCVSKG